MHTLDRVRRAILAWYAAEHRDFPWRGTSDPYAVLVSEVMLQQTQASRVAERFPRFMARFPTAEALAATSAAEVLAEWSGLGYNRRAIALQRTARHVTQEGWPRDVAGLERLPGVGPYTARAIASLCFGTRVGVVDTNVRRWLLRRFDVADRPHDLQVLADALAAAGRADHEQTPAWTHATMEFGASICTSRAPRCGACPVARGCPSRPAPARIPVARQAAFAGSTRAHRGAILRALAAAPDQALAVAALPPVHSAAEREVLLDRLERDGLVHRSGGMVALGSRPDRQEPVT